MAEIGFKKVREVYDNLFDYLNATLTNANGTGSTRPIRKVVKGEIGMSELPPQSIAMQFLGDVKVGRTSDHDIRRIHFKLRVVVEPESANEPDASALIKMALVDNAVDAYNFNYSNGAFQNGAFGMSDPEWSLSYSAHSQTHGAIVVAECLRSFRVVVQKSNN